MQSLLRSVYVDPPAQFVIIDVGIPMPANITTNIVKTLQNMVCLGPHRIPAIGVAVINKRFEQVLGLTTTKTDQLRIIEAIKSITDMGRYRSNIHKEEFKNCVHLGINHALQEFTVLPAKLSGGERCPSKIQVVILSMRNGMEMKSTAEQVVAVNENCAEIVKKILVIEVFEEHLNPASTSNAIVSSPLIEYKKVVGSEVRLDQFMKHCLLRYTTDREHIKLVIKEMVILCDIQESVIAMIPPEEGEVPRLEVVDRVSEEQVPEAAMGGHPLFLLPSESPCLHPAQRLQNNQYFLSLSENLTQLDQFLVALQRRDGLPHKYFIIVPGEDLFMVKSLVCPELALPMRGFDHRSVITTAEIDSYVKETLRGFPTNPNFHLDMYPTSLHQHALKCVEKQARQQSMGIDAENQPILFTWDVTRTIKIKKPSRGKASKRKHENNRETNDCPSFSGYDQQHLEDLMSRRNPLFKF